MKYTNKKNSSLLIKLLLIATMSSCESSWYHEYVIKNDTDYRILIEAYDVNGTSKKNNTPVDTININAHSYYSVLKGNGFEGEEQGVFKNEQVDSVVIHFDNNRILIFSCGNDYGSACFFDRNIMNYNNEDDFIKTKKGKSNGNIEYKFTYMITNEDYNNSISITK